jgi:hypothetical protein
MQVILPFRLARLNRGTLCSLRMAKPYVPALAFRRLRQLGALLGNSNRLNLTGNGFLGMRGYCIPDATTNFCRLTKYDAERLNMCDYVEERKLSAKRWPAAKAVAQQPSGVEQPILPPLQSRQSPRLLADSPFRAEGIDDIGRTGLQI